MIEVSHRNFGLLIAYLIPGFVIVWGASYFSETVSSWLSTNPEQTPTIGGFLYVTIASVAAGVTVSAIRWAVVDTLHHLTGLPLPDWNFADYPTKLAAFNAIVHDHYRYYQFYANMLVAVAFAYGVTLIHGDMARGDAAWLSGGVAFLELVLLAGSRDSLRKYYSRATLLLGTRRSEGQASDEAGEATAPRGKQLTPARPAGESRSA